MAQRLPGNKRERVKDLRMERGLSLSELASRVGCNETTLGRYERGETDRIGDEIVRSLAREFNVSIDYLMGETDIPYVKNFDISELGLSAESAQRLLTRKVNVEVVNRMLEHPNFPVLTLMISQYFHDTFSAGFAGRNHILDMANQFLFSQSTPQNISAVAQAVTDINLQKISPHEVDCAKITNCFMAMLKNIKADMDKQKPTGQPITKEAIQAMYAVTPKGSEAIPEKPSVKVDQLANAVAAFAQQKHQLGPKYQKLFEEFAREFVRLQQEDASEQ